MKMWIIDKFGNRVWQPIKNARIARMMSRVFFEGEGGEGGGGGGGEETVESLKAKLATAEAAATALKNTNITILDEKKKLAGVASLVEKLGGQEALDQLLQFKTKVEQDEILQLAMNGKPQEAIERATERLRLSHTAEKDQLTGEVTKYKTEAESAKEQLRTLIVDNAVVRDFVSVKGIEAAIPDVLYRARSVFTVEEGIPVARNADGSLMQGKNGALTVKEWCEGLKEKAPHYFPQSAGSNLPEGDNNPDNFALALVEAAKKGPTALRAEKERQAKIKSGKK
jgi:hypothetical protein